MTARTLADAKPGERVTFANGERAIVIRRDDDDFDKQVLVYCPERRKRSMDDARRYHFALTCVIREPGE